MSKETIVKLLAVTVLSVSLLTSCVNTIINNTMGKDLSKLSGEPKIGKWYSVSVEGAVNSDGTMCHGFFRKGSENKVIIYFYGGGFSVNDFTAARSMDVEGGFYNPRINTGLNVMTYAIRNWGIGNKAKENVFKDWTFIGVPYCNGDFHAGQGVKEYTALDGSIKTINYTGYENYRLLMDEVFKYIGNEPDQLFITGSSAGGFGAAILADDVIETFGEPEDVTVLVDSSLLITDNWHYIMVNEWNSPSKLSDVVSSDNITLDSLVALSKKRSNVKILFDCSVRDYNLSMAQRFFDEGAQSEMALDIGKAEGDRFQELLKKMVKDLQEQIPGSGVYIWDEVTQKNGHLTVHTGTGTKIYYDGKKRNPSLGKWVSDAVNGDVKSYGLELLEKEYD